ncbi:MAG: hypothetical protein ABSA11_12205 [Candidatus Bathyarchaeia archaeon]
MGEERKPEVEEGPEEQVQECCGGPEERSEHHGPHAPHDGPHGPPGGPHGPAGEHWMDRRAMMRFASMTVDEEVEFLESVKVRLEDRLKGVNDRLTKLKA